ncbi:hypothetical protein COV24_02925 [candidate division WWE3 bacterium CG10_big_fil_rev_8_21_14_0_10_32_10]|uniref:Uncharacterized protein n=1 Tax=candidate division WWE3 bacterium CG10_big_fil_rev_8_21_14_0_10_32_10 TaxID=1975090 RepID=A0A2H0RBH1_UNCKA|nr:MAG: hypothetical protein COV24_02925 [candidate division WWE3 bacterium CG10_big_fil_rev_8_21_14_0_10_32_10]
MNNKLSIARKLEIYFYVILMLVGIYLTLTWVEFNIVTSIIDNKLPQVGTELDWGLISGLLFTGNGLAFLIISAKI